jgi:hypothetical protein
MVIVKISLKYGHNDNMTEIAAVVLSPTNDRLTYYLPFNPLQ